MAGPLSGYILSVYDWRALFGVEGLMSLAFAAIWFPLMSETPASARWLSQGERDYLASELASDARREQDQKIERAGISALLRDRNLFPPRFQLEPSGTAPAARSWSRVIPNSGSLGGVGDVAGALGAQPSKSRRSSHSWLSSIAGGSSHAESGAMPLLSAYAPAPECSTARTMC
jgi:hypothetical protein